MNGKKGGRPRKPAAPAVAPVRFEGRVPATLRNWIAKHAADKVYKVHHGGGFTTDSGIAYDVGINNGWCVTYPDRNHTVIEPTVRDVIDCLKTLERCDCDQCQAGDKFLG